LVPSWGHRGTRRRRRVNRPRSFAGRAPSGKYLIVALLLWAALALWTAAAVVTARRLALTRAVLAAEAVLAGGRVGGSAGYAKGE
jgi:hypothetical protein